MSDDIAITLKLIPDLSPDGFLRKCYDEWVEDAAYYREHPEIDCPADYSEDPAVRGVRRPDRLGSGGRDPVDVRDCGRLHCYARVSGTRVSGTISGMETNVTSIEIFQGIDEQWYYRAKAGNGETVADSEGYTEQGHAVRAAEATFPGVPHKIV